MTSKQKIKVLFGCRICLWVTALIATVYWIYWSFHIYSFGVMDEHEYAVLFRPIFAKALLVSVGAIVLSFILRSISDHIKANDKKQ